MLLQGGANLSARNNGGKTPIAVSRNHATRAAISDEVDRRKQADQQRRAEEQEPPRAISHSKSHARSHPQPQLHVRTPPARSSSRLRAHRGSNGGGEYCDGDQGGGGGRGGGRGWKRSEARLSPRVVRAATFAAADGATSPLLPAVTPVQHTRVNARTTPRSDTWRSPGAGACCSFRSGGGGGGKENTTRSANASASANASTHVDADTNGNDDGDGGRSGTKGTAMGDGTTTAAAAGCASFCPSSPPTPLIGYDTPRRRPRSNEVTLNPKP